MRSTARIRPRRTAANFARALLLAAMCALPLHAQEMQQKPKVRAVTAFLRIDRANYPVQIAETLKMLRRAKEIFEKGGYEVQTIRIVTQPFPEYAGKLSREEAMKFFRALDALAAKEDFDPNIGPAMMRDSDDPAHAELLAEILCTTKLNASIIIAGDDGIHWNAVRAAAKLVKYVSEHSPHSQGTFGFAATAMLAPYAPFYPGAYHTGAGKQFAVALEAANVVDEAFTGTRGDARTASARLTQALGAHAAAIEKLARAAEKETAWTYMGMDPTPAPLKDISIGAAIEKFTGVRFGKATGVPVVLNTSFNLKGEPIVNTPANAFHTFSQSEMDCLVMENFLVEKGSF